MEFSNARIHLHGAGCVDLFVRTLEGGCVPRGRNQPCRNYVWTVSNAAGSPRWAIPFEQRAEAFGAHRLRALRICTSTPVIRNLHSQRASLTP